VQAHFSSGRSRQFKIEDLKMKKLVLALTALAAFTGSASAADLAARPYTKAPAPIARL
jgi:outer membrane immunogenic protein